MQDGGSAPEQDACGKHVNLLDPGKVLRSYSVIETRIPFSHWPRTPSPSTIHRHSTQHMTEPGNASYLTLGEASESSVRGSILQSTWEKEQLTI